LWLINGLRLRLYNSLVFDSDKKKCVCPDGLVFDRDKKCVCPDGLVFDRDKKKCVCPDGLVFDN
jgi:hypothetical protein